MEMSVSWFEIVETLGNPFDYDDFLRECKRKQVVTLFSLERYAQILGIVYYYMSKGQDFHTAVHSFSNHKSSTHVGVVGNPGVQECGGCGGGKVR